MTSTDTKTTRAQSSPTESSPTETADAHRPPATVWPTLQAHDAPALIDFYVKAFGFVATAVYADGDQVAHAQLDWPDGGGIMLGSYKPDAQWSRQPGTSGAYVATDRIDEVYARVRGAGATIIRELTQPSYGGREFSVQDPEGNLWSFGSYRGEPRS